jgi:hypothetical protein
MKTITSLLALFLATAAATTTSAETLPYALGLFESGAETFQRGQPDYKRGDSGEVSRYQIMPEVWKRYAKSGDYHDPAVAWKVAEQILIDRLGTFRERMHRDPTPTELYLLWNKPGHFSAAHYSLSRVSRHYLNRARRFGNLFRAVEISYQKQANDKIQQVAMAAAAEQKG